MNKIIFLISAVVLLLTFCTRTEEEGFTFAYLTDIHLQAELDAIEGFQKAIDTINQIKPDFVLTGGDLIMDALGQTFGRADSLYNMYTKQVEGFNMPLYNTMGNHEIFGWYMDEEEITSHPEFGKKMFENRIGKRYYSYDHEGWHFIVLDGISRKDDGGYYGYIDEEQIEWLKKDLEKTGKEKPLALSVHIPFITSRTQITKGTTVGNDPGSVITNGLDVLRILYPYNLRLVLQGHLHFLEDIYIGEKTHFITAGAVCGRWWSNKPCAIPEEGFLLVKVKGDKIKWKYVDYGWTPKI